MTRAHRAQQSTAQHRQQSFIFMFCSKLERKAIKAVHIMVKFGSLFGSLSVSCALSENLSKICNVVDNADIFVPPPPAEFKYPPVVHQHHAFTANCCHVKRGDWKPFWPSGNLFTSHFQLFDNILRNIFETQPQIHWNWHDIYRSWIFIDVLLSLNVIVCAWRAATCAVSPV